MLTEELRSFLDEKVDEYNNRSFVEDDPISIPDRFRNGISQDVEISGFIAATLAWGQRKTIINKCNELMGLMDDSPYEFIMHHTQDDLKRLSTFKHRTFNAVDLTYFISWFKWFYQHNTSLEHAFVTPDGAMESSLTNFHNLFCSLDHFPSRTRKHIATPARKSACKRLNMYLRWMVRSGDRQVDFGLWDQIKPSQLVCPCDVHVDRVARRFGLIQRKQTDWLAAMELTENLRELDPEDPVKYDFALFGLGVIEKF